MTAGQVAASGHRASLGQLLVVGRGRHTGASHEHLAARGFQLTEARTFARAERALASGAFDLVIIEALEEPDQAVDHCRRFADSDCGLIVIHGAADPALPIRALEAGADDCLPVNHNPRELSARVRSVLRRRDKARQVDCGRFLAFDEFALDLAKHVLHAPGGIRVPITPKQFRILAALASRAGEVISREELFEVAYGTASDAFDRAVDVQISRLRKALASISGAELITAFRGAGYRLNASVRR